MNGSTWPRVRLKDLGTWFGGGTPSKSNQAFWTDGTVPWLSPKDMGPEVLAGTHDHITQDAVENSSVKRVPAGSVALVVRSGILERTLPVALVPFDTTLNQDMKAVAARPDIDARWIAWGLRAYEQEILDTCRKAGTTVASMEMPRLYEHTIPVPPLDEQRRIVDILEDHLSRLDAATALAMSAARRLDILQMSGLWRATHGLPGSEALTLSDVAEVRLGRQRSPKNHMGNRMRPYFRAANVGWDELRLDDVKQMQFTESESATYELCDGDILLTEASGSASEVGKSAIYRGEVSGVCFQNTLLRVRCHEGVDPKFVQLYLLAEARLGKFVAESRGVGIIHLGRARLASWPILLPTGDLQIAMVKRVRELVEATARARECAQIATIRAHGLRRSLLAAAFAGQLTGRTTDMEMVEEMAGV